VPFAYFALTVAEAEEVVRELAITRCSGRSCGISAARYSKRSSDGTPRTARAAAGRG
jgi:hypothetical protein